MELLAERERKSEIERESERDPQGRGCEDLEGNLGYPKKRERERGTGQKNGVFNDESKTRRKISC